jgi:hypothetical protein
MQEHEQAGPGVALCLPSPDWLANRLTVSGPEAELADFLAAAAGPGVVPWRVDPACLAEAWFNCMIAVPPQGRGISVAGARSLAERLGDAAAAWDAMMRSERRARACPLDLHALIPLPGDLLARGPDDPAAIVWMWAHWGTTFPLRHVAMVPAPARGVPQKSGGPRIGSGASILGVPPRPSLREGEGRVRFDFYSADWSPWPALAHMRAHWPGLAFTLRPDYGAERDPSAAPGPRQSDRAAEA